MIGLENSVVASFPKIKETRVELIHFLKII